MRNFSIVTDNKYEVEIKEENVGKVTIYRFAFRFESHISPKEIKISWMEKNRGYAYAYAPMNGSKYNLTPDWAPVSVWSSICVEMPALFLLNEYGNAQLSFAVSEVSSPKQLSFGYHEEDGEIEATVRLFVSPGPAIDRYEVALRFDEEENNTFTAGQRIVQWWNQIIGNNNEEIPNAAYEPVYSTWYNFHQDVTQRELTEECSIATRMGMKTFILDDGWQTEDTHRGYAYCGDWEMCKNKFPDFKQFVSDLHALGMRVVVWYSVPFVGEYSRAYQLFKNKILPNDTTPHTYVLDPRYKEVRKYLTDIYCSAIKEYDIDGFKLDFIDYFRFGGEFFYREEMDCYSVESGVEKLLSEIQSEVSKIKKDVLIEFRQRYYGPYICKFANMLRVADCPGDSLANLVESIRMRSFTSSRAIHSDMLTCPPDCSMSEFLRTLVTVMFSVPQFSFRLKTLNEEKTRALQWFIDFVTQHQQTLLQSNLKVYAPQNGVSRVDAIGKEETITVLYVDSEVKIKNSPKQLIVNGRSEEGIIIQTDDHEYSYVLRNCFGEVIKTGRIPANAMEYYAIGIAELMELNMAE